MGCLQSKEEKRPSHDPYVAIESEGKETGDAAGGSLLKSPVGERSPLLDAAAAGVHEAVSAEEEAGPEETEDLDIALEELQEVLGKLEKASGTAEKLAAVRLSQARTNQYVAWVDRSRSLLKIVKVELRNVSRATASEWQEAHSLIDISERIDGYEQALVSAAAPPKRVRKKSKKRIKYDSSESSETESDEEKSLKGSTKDDADSERIARLQSNASAAREEAERLAAVIAGQGHNWSVTTFKSPHNCSACGQLLVGVYHQGQRCKTCKKTAHTKCLHDVGDCAGATPEKREKQGSGLVPGPVPADRKDTPDPRKTKVAPNMVFASSKPTEHRDTPDPFGKKGKSVAGSQQHSWEKHTYLTPSDCDHCDKLLVGIRKQGLRCMSCKMDVHKHCKDAVKSCGKPSSTAASAPTQDGNGRSEEDALATPKQTPSTPAASAARQLELDSPIPLHTSEGSGVVPGEARAKDGAESTEASVAVGGASDTAAAVDKGEEVLDDPVPVTHGSETARIDPEEDEKEQRNSHHHRRKKSVGNDDQSEKHASSRQKRSGEKDEHADTSGDSRKSHHRRHKSGDDADQETARDDHDARKKKHHKKKKPHKWEEHNYMAPTKCDVCDKLLKGLRHQGVRCARCEMDVHEECLEVAKSCKKPVGRVKSPSDQDREQDDCVHDWAKHTYHVPTNCDSCDKLLVGLRHQGLQCSKCHRNRHKKGCQ